MLCLSCGEPTDVRPCPGCGGEPLLDGRYRLLAMLGHGAVGTTYRAERLADGQPVAIKELLLRRADGLKALQLFEREAAVLGSLEHPGVPRYHEHLTAGAGKQIGFYLVQELIDGQTLQAELASRRLTEPEIVDLLEEIAGILQYLHTRTPPVVHRDLKPANLMRRHADGRLVLIDFGCVRDALHDPKLGGSTVAGTYGYMAPEQFAGRALPQSDLYALGALAVALLSRRDPQELLAADHRIDWRHRVTVGAELGRLIDDLLQPEPQRRPPDAAAVLRRLRQTESAAEVGQRVAQLLHTDKPLAASVATGWLDTSHAARTGPTTRPGLPGAIRLQRELAAAAPSSVRAATTRADPGADGELKSPERS